MIFTSGLLLTLVSAGFAWIHRWSRAAGGRLVWQHAELLVDLYQMTRGPALVVYKYPQFSPFDS